MAHTPGFPIKKNAEFLLIFPIYNSEGSLVSGATGLDSEISKDGGSFADCTNEATEIATNSGIYKLTLTATEMNADVVAVITKTSTEGAKTAATIIYTSANQIGDVKTVADGIKTKTDQLNFTGTDVKATLDGEEVTTDSASRNASKADVSNLDAAVSSRASETGGNISSILDDTNELQTRLNNMIEADGADWRYTTNALEQAPTGGSAPTVGEIADGVWDEAIADHQSAGSFGLKNQKAVPSETLNDYKADVSNLDVAVSSRSSHGDPTSAIKGSPGKTLQEVYDNEKGTDGAYTGTPPTVGEIRTEMEKAETKLTAIKDKTDLIGSSVQPDKSTEIDGIKSKTDLIGASVQIDKSTEIDAIKTKTDLIGTSVQEDKSTEIDAIKTETDKLNNMIEADGADFRYTQNALEQAPGGEGSSPSAIADAVWDELGSEHTTSGSFGSRLDAKVSTSGGAAGPGGIEKTYTVKDGDGNPLADVDVWVTTDKAGSNVIASGKTGQNGEVKFMLNEGKIFIWLQKTGYNFSPQPDEEVV